MGPRNTSLRKCGSVCWKLVCCNLILICVSWRPRVKLSVIVNICISFKNKTKAFNFGFQNFSALWRLFQTLILLKAYLLNEFRFLTKTVISFFKYPPSDSWNLRIYFKTVFHLHEISKVISLVSSAHSATFSYSSSQRRKGSSGHTATHICNCWLCSCRRNRAILQRDHPSAQFPGLLRPGLRYIVADR